MRMDCTDTKSSFWIQHGWHVRNALACVKVNMSHRQANSLVVLLHGFFTYTNWIFYFLRCSSNALFPSSSVSHSVGFVMCSTSFVYGSAKGRHDLAHHLSQQRHLTSAPLPVLRLRYGAASACSKDRA
jgi:hypothetical protein